MRALVERVAARLAGSGVGSPRAVAEWLVSAALGCRKLDVYVRPPVLTEACAARIEEWTRRVCSGEPVQYVLGETDFFGMTFRVDGRALIPRPETEQLVARVLDRSALREKGDGLVGVDVGTGSGCIPIVLAVHLPAVRWLAVDVSAAALDLARENERRLLPAPRIGWREGDLLDSFAPESVDLITANLPYIPSGDCDRLPREVALHEPRRALDGGPDGLVLVRALIGQAAGTLRKDGWIFLEIGHDQGQAVGDMLLGNGFEDVRTGADLAGQVRFAEGRKP